MFSNYIKHLCYQIIVLILVKHVFVFSLTISLMYLLLLYLPYIESVTHSGVTRDADVFKVRNCPNSTHGITYYCFDIVISLD